MQASDEKRRSPSINRDSVLDNSDLSVPINGSMMRAKLSSKPKTIKKGKKKYKLFYQIEKVVQVPVDSDGNVSAWDSSTQPIDQTKQRASKSVRPRQQRFKAQLPQVLNQPSIDEKDNKVEATASKPSSPMRQFKEKTTFSRRKYSHVQSEARQSPQRVSHVSRKHKKALMSLQNSGSVEREVQVEFKNPQQEAQYRQQKLLDKIRRVSVPVGQEGQLQSANGKLYILKEKAGGGSKLSSQLGSPSERKMIVQQPSHGSQLEYASSSGPQQDQQGSSPFDPTNVPLTSLTRRESMATAAENPRQQMLPVEPRQLVSEEGGIVNLAVESEFDPPRSKVRQHKLRALNNRSKRGTKMDRDFNSIEISPDSRDLTSVGTGVQLRTMQRQADKQSKKEHARFLVELMSPFASRAGTQGITSHSNRSISQRPRDYMKPEYNAMRLNPITQALIHRSQRNYFPQASTNTTKRTTPRQQFISDRDDGTSSVDTKKSPFRQQLTAKASSNGLSRNEIAKAQTIVPQDASSVQMHTQTSLYPATTTSSGIVHTADGSKRTTARLSNIKGPFEQRKLSLNNPSERNLNDHGKLPYMTVNSCHLATKRRSEVPESLKERTKLLPLKIQKEIQSTQTNQLFEFYEAMLQPSTLPFTQEAKVASVAPKIGDKVSMLGNVRETLTKRYQLAKSARIEAGRRMRMIGTIRQLRTFIRHEVDYKPMVGMQDQKLVLLDFIAYNEPTLINDDLWDLLREIYNCKESSRRVAAAYKIQTWARMAIRRNKYKKVISAIVSIQRLFRHYKLQKFFAMVKIELQKRAVLLLQKYLRGYLVYNRYYAKLKGTMTKKNLDYIITRYADAKEYMRECLQVQLAYLTRKMIKRKKIEAEERRKAELAEKKRIAREKELERLRKIHEERKNKKRQVRSMLKETVEICYTKEDERRETAFAKIKKQSMNQPNRKVQSKNDITMEAVTLAFKQELFEGCYKKITKRIAAAKKKAKANKDLKSVSKQSSTMNQSMVGAALGKKKESNDSPSPSLQKKTPKQSNMNVARAVADATPDAKSSALKKEPLLDPHHLQLVQVGKKVKMVKYEKHPNPKLRRNYKDMVAIECTVECLQKENEKYQDDLASNDKSNRATSKQSTQRKIGGKAQVKRQETPESVNISIVAPMGATTPQAENQGVIGSFQDMTGAINVKRRNTIALVQQAASTLDEIRVASNDDLSIIDSDCTSNTSDELSENSETYDFLMVYMPLIRPKEPGESDEEPKVEDEKKGKGSKSAKKKKTSPAPRRSETTANVKQQLGTLIDSAQPNLPLIRKNTSQLSNPTSTSGNPIGAINTIEEETQQQLTSPSQEIPSVLPPPQQPLSVIVSREELIVGGQSTNQDKALNDFSAPFSNTTSQEDIGKVNLESKLPADQQIKVTEILNEDGVTVEGALNTAKEGGSGAETPDTDEIEKKKLSNVNSLVIKDNTLSSATLMTKKGKIYHTESETILFHGRSERPVLVNIMSSSARESSQEESNYQLSNRLAQLDAGSEDLLEETEENKE